MVWIKRRSAAVLSDLLMLGAQLIFFYNVIKTWMSGPAAGKNPWRANTLEWTAASPPPHGNWPEGLPNVYRGPCEYSHPHPDADYAPQKQPA